MTKHFITIFTLLALSLPAHANSSFGTHTVKRIIIHDSGNIIIGFSGSDVHSESCTEKSSYMLVNDHPHFDQMYAGLLAALHSGATVKGWVNGCVAWWGRTSTKITRLDFHSAQP